MKREIVSFLIMFLSVAASVYAVFRFRLKRDMILPGVLTGIVIAVLNMLVEFIGAKFDVYYVSGPWVVGSTPLPLTIGWVFFSFLFCVGYVKITRGGQDRSLISMYTLGGVVAGCLADYMFYRFADILRLGERGSSYIIITVWLIFVPLTVFLYGFFSGLLSEGQSGTAR